MSGDNQNENKFMAMLERRGIVRKVPLEDDSPAMAHVGAAVRAEADTDSTGSQYNDELNSLLQKADASLAEPNAQEELLRETSAGAQRPVAPVEYHQPAQSFETPAEPSSPTREYMPGYTAQAHPVEPYAQNIAYDETPASQQSSEETTSRDNMFSWMGNEDAATAAPPSLDTSTERYLDVEELYEVLSLRSKKTDTIYLIEDYLKSIPDSLPDESRRQIVAKIIAASGFDYDLLMGDGILRVKMLKEYAEKFARHTDDFVEARLAEISALESEHERIQKLIDNRRELHKKQFLSIEAEAGRLREILTFING